MKNAFNKNSGEHPTQADFIAKCKATDFDRPNTSVDTVIFTVIDHYLHVLTIKRCEPPFKDTWSLVGGYIDTKSDPDI